MKPVSEQQQAEARSVDVTGLSEEAVRAVEHVVRAFRGQPDPPRLGGTAAFATREEWVRAVGEYADGHPPLPAAADDSREGIYAGRGE